MRRRHDAARILPQTDTMLSPCIQVCVIDPRSALCVGCKRSLAEIASWSTLSPAERRQIMADLDSRQTDQDLVTP